MSNETKVIPVWITPREVAHITQPMGWAADIYAYEIAPPSIASTLIIGDKAMPMAKVRDMLKEMEDAIECVDVGSCGVFCGVKAEKFCTIASKYGVDL